MKNKKIFIISGVIFLFIVLSVIFVVWGNSPIKKGDYQQDFIVKTGENKIEIINNLKKEGIIRSRVVGLAYVFFNPSINLQAGDYLINLNNSTFDIIKQIGTGNTGRLAKSVSITFVEGRRLTEYVTQISEKFDYSYDEIIQKISDETYLNSLIEEYWFLDYSILDEQVYYPLEGFLFADTYSFYEDASIEDIIEKMLLQTESKLSPYKDKIKSGRYTAKDIITIASIVEMEAITKEDRQKVSSVIYNRLSISMQLGMDTTTYYGVGKELTENLTVVDLNTKNGYNTREVSFIGLPVGPICSPSLMSIDAAINPADTNYYYFYAVDGKDNFFETKEAFYEFQRNL